MLISGHVDLKGMLISGHVDVLLGRNGYPILSRCLPLLYPFDSQGAIWYMMPYPGNLGAVTGQVGAVIHHRRRRVSHQCQPTRTSISCLGLPHLYGGLSHYRLPASSGH
jgi:hypothetical protein